MATAVRRLNVMEFVLLGMAGVLALLGGALAAFALQGALGFPFRTAWAVSSLLFFVVPGVVVLMRERRARDTTQTRGARASVKETDG